MVVEQAVALQGGHSQSKAFLKSACWCRLYIEHTVLASGPLATTVGQQRTCLSQVQGVTGISPASAV